MQALSSILDLPNKTLPPTIWDTAPGKLPVLNPQARKVILQKVADLQDQYNLNKIYGIHIYGGAASYQWHPGSDIDVSVYMQWSDSLLPKQDNLQAVFKSIEIPYEGFVIHLFLKPPEQSNLYEVADSYYDVINNNWVVEPLELPSDYDPAVVFAPFLNHAEEVAQKIDKALGYLRRSIAFYRRMQAQLETAKDRQLVEKKLKNTKSNIKKLIEALINQFENLRERRNQLHTLLRDSPSNPEARFGEPEIVWKYLDSNGLSDILYKLKVYNSSNTFNLDFPV